MSNPPISYLESIVYEIVPPKLMIPRGLLASGRFARGYRVTRGFEGMSTMNHANQSSNSPFAAASLIADNELPAAGNCFQGSFPARTLGATGEDTTTSSSHYGDTALRRRCARAQVTPGCEEQNPVPGPPFRQKRARRACPERSR